MIYKDNFITKIIKKDILDGLDKIQTRFPPEPNGCLHIGHIKSILLNFELNKIFPSKLPILRFDDTNPKTSRIKFINGILEDLDWLGYKKDINFKISFASNYFDKIFKFAYKLILNNKAYVCDLNKENTKEYRGNFLKIGINSPYRNRSIKENIKKFINMKDGIYPRNFCTLRAKINMSSGNMNLRDPIIFRIKKDDHQILKNNFNIYPTYDFAHTICDAIENITHSICTNEFKDHAPLYKWILKNFNNSKKFPKQIEFSKLQFKNINIGKRFVKKLIDKNIVKNYSDIRLMTISAMKKRGFNPIAIKNFFRLISISNKQESIISIDTFKNSIRKFFDKSSVRKNCVLNPIKINIIGFPKNLKYIKFKNHPKNKEFGYRNVSISKEIYIESNDLNLFLKDKNLNSETNYIRLMNAITIKIEKININKKIFHFKYISTNLVKEKTKKYKILHWVDASNYIDLSVYKYKFLSKDYKNQFNTIEKFNNAKSEYSLKDFLKNKILQFTRLGYFFIYKKIKNKIYVKQSLSIKK